MTAPDKLGCRVLDKDGDDETEGAYEAIGYSEAKAIRRATHLASVLPDYAPYRVVDADGVTLHTIYATREGM